MGPGFRRDDNDHRSRRPLPLHPFRPHL